MAAECAKFTQVVLRLACARILENACALAVTYIHLWMYGCVDVHKYAHTHTARVAAVPFSHFFAPSTPMPSVSRDIGDLYTGC